MNFSTKTCMILIIRIISGMKVIEIPNSNIRDINDITICGRIMSHQYSSKPQRIFQIQTEMGVFGLGTFPGFDCDEVYRGSLHTRLYERNPS